VVVSPFWKGVIWAAKAAKLGYQWKVGNGKKIKFWEDHWFGSSSLAIHYREIYFLINEQNGTIAELWDGTQLKVTFRRCFDHNQMLLWYEILQIAQTLHVTEKDDNILWKLESNGMYSVKILICSVNF
jgi:hypothetical protein